MCPGVFVEGDVVVARIGPVDRGRVGRVKDEGLNVVAVAIACKGNAVATQLDGWRQIHLLVVASLGATLIVREAKFKNAKPFRLPEGVVFIRVAESITWCTILRPCTQSRLHFAERRAIIHHPCCEVIDLLTRLWGDVAVVGAIRQIETEKLIIGRVGTHVSDQHRIPKHQSQIRQVLHIGKTSRWKGHCRIGDGAVRVDDIHTQE